MYPESIYLDMTIVMYIAEEMSDSWETEPEASF